MNINHQNILKIIDVIDNLPYVCIIMEECEGNLLDLFGSDPEIFREPFVINVVH